MSMTGAWLTDNRRLDHLEYDAALLRRSGVAVAKLPPLVRVGLVDRSRCSPRWPSSWGIPATCTWSPGCPTCTATTVGSGCVRPYETHLSIGTTAWVGCPLPSKKTDVIRQLAAVPGSADGAARRTSWPTTRRAPAGACSGSRAWCGWRRTAPVVRRDHRAGRDRAARLRRGDLRALDRGRTVTGRRPLRAGRLPQRLRQPPRRADLARSVLEGVAFNAALAAGCRRALHRPSSRSAADGRAEEPSRSCGVGSWPTSATGPWSGSPTRCCPACAAPPWRPASRSVTSTGTSCAGSVPVGRDLPARPGEPCGLRPVLRGVPAPLPIAAAHVPQAERHPGASVAPTSPPAWRGSGPLVATTREATLTAGEALEHRLPQRRR